LFFINWFCQFLLFLIFVILCIVFIFGCLNLFSVSITIEFYCMQTLWCSFWFDRHHFVNGIQTSSLLLKFWTNDYIHFIFCCMYIFHSILVFLFMFFTVDWNALNLIICSDIECVYLNFNVAVVLLRGEGCRHDQLGKTTWRSSWKFWSLEERDVNLRHVYNCMTLT
jgi:hypothetical protein